MSSPQVLHDQYHFRIRALVFGDLHVESIRAWRELHPGFFKVSHLGGAMGRGGAEPVLKLTQNRPLWEGAC